MSSLPSEGGLGSFSWAFPCGTVEQGLQGPVSDRLVPSLVAFVAVGHVSASYPSFLPVPSTFVSPVAARHGVLPCQLALRCLPHTSPSDRRAHHHQLRLPGRRVVGTYVPLLLW